MLILICNSLLYWVTFLYFYRKDKMRISTLLWLYYAVFSTFGVLLLDDGQYFYIMGIPDGNKRLQNLSFEPYILLYLTFYLFVTPLRRVIVENFDFSKVGISHASLYKITKACLFLEIIYILIKIPQVYIISKVGFGTYHDLVQQNPLIEEQLLYGGGLGLILKLFNYAGRLVNMVFMPTLLIYSTYMYINKSFPKRMFLWLVGSFIVGLLIRGIVGGSRGAMFFSVLELFFFYFLFVEYLSPKLKRKIKGIGLSMVSIIILVTIYVSIDRNEGISSSTTSSATVSENIFRYFGEMWPNLGLELWDRMKEHPKGEMLFGNLSNETDPNITEKWYYKTNVHSWWFKTVLGRLYYEYGKLMAMLIIFSIAAVIRKFLNRRTYYLAHMGLIAYIFSFCTVCLFDFVSLSWLFIFELLSLILLYLILKPHRRIVC